MKRIVLVFETEIQLIFFIPIPKKTTFQAFETSSLRKPVVSRWNDKKDVKNIKCARGLCVCLCVQYDVVMRVCFVQQMGGNLSQEAATSPILVLHPKE